MKYEWSHELGKKFSQRNLDAMFRLILIIYGEKDTKKYITKFMLDNIRNECKFNKNRF